MIDIDWSKAPEGATHYNDSGDHYPWERRHGDALSYVGHDGKWHELSEGGTFEWPDAIPRPAKHRDWSDEAMWFDAPDWAAAVVAGANEFEGNLYYVDSAATNGEAIQEVGIDSTWAIESGYGLGPLVATRPSPKQTVDASIESVGNTLDSAGDNVNHPSHYTQGNIECIDAIESATAGKTGIEAVCVANVIKYLWRYEEKNGAEDVKKAEWYLRKLLGHLNKS